MHIVIVGNGISGVSAARTIRKLSDYKITLISDESEHFFSRTALMYIYMGHMKYEHTKPYEDNFWSKNRISLKKARVVALHVQQKTLELNDGSSLSYDKLILATGSVPRSLPIPGSNLQGVQSLYSLQDLEKMEASTKGIRTALILGGGLIGIEMAEMLHSRGINCTIIVRESHYWGNVLPEPEGKLLGRHIQKHGLRLICNSGIKTIESNNGTRVNRVETIQSELIQADFVGITVGVQPNVAWLSSSGLAIDQGILADEYLRSNIEDVFTAGDCAQLRQPKSGRQAIEPVWYSGRIMGETLGHTICGMPRVYNPGLWFNSAKFFDIEYQVYGKVPPQAEEGLEQFYWEDREAEKCIRLVFDKATNALVGCHALGIRLRHAVLESWIMEKWKIGDVLGKWKKANFDAEFSPDYEKQLLKSFQSQFPEIQIKKGVLSRWM
jgi:3-phenylpropionate/trans-cinnamate dioxygenase ferredoxin reductase component